MSTWAIADQRRIIPLAASTRAMGKTHEAQLARAD
jgi:hypothetical protein